MDQAERTAHAWAVGAAGEALVAKKITELEGLGWLALHDVHWPGRPKANVDHILVGPGGIVVVDAKNWSGEVRLRAGILRQNGYTREPEIAGVLQQSAAVAALLDPNHRRLVQGWICLVGQPELRGTTNSGIRLQGLNTLVPAVAALPAVLDTALVPIIHGYLQQALGGTTSPQLLTTAQFVPQQRSAGQFGPPDAPAATLRQWRSRPAPTRNTGPKRSSRGRSKRPSCLAALLQFLLVIVVAMMVINYASQYRPAAPTAPQPTPSISQAPPPR
ncbi:hypothetical protein ASG71_10225 [Arthrobacter sp. Soil763]|nr:hypothetical protein ASG71_10225 [Arthrobacter sp. Soil763]